VFQQSEGGLRRRGSKETKDMHMQKYIFAKHYNIWNIFDSILCILSNTYVYVIFRRRTIGTRKGKKEMEALQSGDNMRYEYTHMQRVLP